MTSATTNVTGSFNSACVNKIEISTNFNESH